jgi:hypothetical protein
MLALAFDSLMTNEAGENPMKSMTYYVKRFLAPVPQSQMAVQGNLWSVCKGSCA